MSPGTLQLLEVAERARNYQERSKVEKKKKGQTRKLGKSSKCGVLEDKYFKEKRILSMSNAAHGLSNWNLKRPLLKTKINAKILYRILNKELANKTRYYVYTRAI